MNTSSTINIGRLQESLPCTAQFVRLSIQKLRLEHRDIAEMPSIWRELSKHIGRRGSLSVDGHFEVGCGVNSTPHIDKVKFPAEAAQLGQLYGSIKGFTARAEERGWGIKQTVPNLTLSVTGIPNAPVMSQMQVRESVALVSDTKQCSEISAELFRLQLPSCFSFSHRRRQTKAINKKLDFIRDQAMAELSNYRKDVLGLEDASSISLRAPLEEQVVVTVSFFQQANVKLDVPDTQEGESFKEGLALARKAPNQHLQKCLADGSATNSLTAYATLKQIAQRAIA